MNQTVKPSRTLGVLSLALLLNACALSPETGTQAKPLAVPSLAQTLKAGDEAETWVKHWPRSNWWRDFHNAELNRLIETALQGNPDLRAAKARLSQAEAVADDRAAQMLPSVGAHVELIQRRFSATDFYGPNGGKTFTGANIDPLVFRYHLDLWGKDQAALEAALGKERAQASELAAARLVLAASIARAYFLLCAGEQASGFAQSLAEKAEDKLSLARLRWERGLTSKDSIHAEEQTLEAARQRVASFSAGTRILRNRIAALAGQGPDWGSSIQASSSAFAERFPLPEQLPLGLLAHRPDVSAALWRVEAAAQSVKVAKTNFYPDINLVGFAGLHSLNLKDLFLSHGASVAYSVGPTITLPIFEGGRLEAALKHEQSAYDGAVEGYNAALLDAVRQVADALAQWRESLSHDSAQENALEAAQAQAKLAEQRYRAGLSTRDGEIDAQAALIEQELKTSALQAEHLQAAVGLMEALGGGYENTTQPIHLGERP